MKKMMKLHYVSLLCALLTLTGLTANERLPENVSAQEVQEKIAMKAERAQREAESFDANSQQQAAGSYSDKVKEVMSSTPINAAVDYQSTNSKAWHFATGVSPRGDHVFLEDASGWNVRRADAYKTLDWYGSDTIALTLAPWFSFYDYALVNGRTGAKVFVELNEVPNDANAYTLWITNIDLNSCRIMLSDNSVWEFGAFEWNVASQWQPAQKVIIGINNRSFFSRRYNFLLNQDAQDYVKADCLY